MDNLTHTAVGLFLSRAGLNRWTPRATAILILAANAPDIDVAAAIGGPVSYLHYHRNLTHAIIAIPVMALLSVALVRLFSRKPLLWGWAFAAAMIGVASHLMLDYTNGYGIRLLLPFSPSFYRLEWTGVIDPWIGAAFLLAIAAPFLARLVGTEITSGSAKQRYPGRGWPIFALGFVLLYNGARSVWHARAIGELQSRIYQGETPLRVAAVPTANPLRWRGIVETRGFYALPEMNLTQPFDPDRARILHKPQSDPAMYVAKPTRPFQVMLRFAEFPLWSAVPAEQPENAKQVSLTDVRFMGWGPTAIVSSTGRILRTWFQLGDGQRPR
jgi:inner membrane protein